MGNLTKVILSAVAAFVVIVVLAAVALPMFLNAGSFRTRIEADLSKSLGRQVSIGKLNLSLLSGGLLAENTVVADDTQFSSQPFIQADTVKIGVEILPLILRREVNIRSFFLQSPKVQLIRAANGTWNYSSIGGASTKQTTPGSQPQDVSVGRVEVADGRVTVAIQTGPGAPSTPSRVYDPDDTRCYRLQLHQGLPVQGRRTLAR